MKKCEAWMVAAVYLMQSAQRSKHYTTIVNYILETGLTEFIEKSAAVSQTINETLKQKVIHGQAVFRSEGNGYFSLADKDALRNNEEIRAVIQCLKDKGYDIKLRGPETSDIQMQDGDDEKLSNEARKLSEESQKISDQIMKLSEEVTHLSVVNKTLRQETDGLRQENEQLREKLLSIRQLCG